MTRLGRPGTPAAAVADVGGQVGADGGAATTPSARLQHREQRARMTGPGRCDGLHTSQTPRLGIS